MWIFIFCCLFFSAIFMILALCGLRRRKKWSKAMRINATVTKIDYNECRPSPEIIDDTKSSREITIRFSCLDQICEKNTEYKGILGAPSQAGDHMKILYDPTSDLWCPAKKMRPYWIIHFIVSLFLLAAAIAFMFRGKQILVQLSDYRVDAPNITGGICLGILGILLLIAAAACFVFFTPFCLRPFFGPILWSIKYIFNAFEPTQARCAGLIREDDKDGGYNYYPLFSCYDPQFGQILWHPAHQKPQKRFQMGEHYTLYRDKKTGACSLMPEPSETVSTILSLIPAGFSLLFTMSLAVIGIGLIYCGIISF